MLVSYGGKNAFRSPKVETTHKSEQNSKLFTKKERTHISVSPPSVGMPKHRYV